MAVGENRQAGAEPMAPSCPTNFSNVTPPAREQAPSPITALKDGPSQASSIRTVRWSAEASALVLQASVRSSDAAAARIDPRRNIVQTLQSFPGRVGTRCTARYASPPRLDLSDIPVDHATRRRVIEGEIALRVGAPRSGAARTSRASPR